MLRKNSLLLKIDIFTVIGGIADFQHMSDSEGDDLPLFGDKDSEDEEEVDLEEKEAELTKKQVWTGSYIFKFFKFWLLFYLLNNYYYYSLIMHSFLMFILFLMSS